MSVFDIQGWYYIKMRYMKKIIFFILFALSFNACLASDFEYLADGIYFQKDSIKVKDGWKFGTFKIMREHLEAVLNDDAEYEILKFGASCHDNKQLGLVSTFVFDKNDNLIDKDDYHKMAVSNYLGFINGEIYYNAICSTRK